MRKFKKNSLRRGLTLLSRKDRSSFDAQTEEAEPRLIHHDGSRFNLVDSQLPFITVSCWLEGRQLIWGTHKDCNTAILPLTIDAIDALGFKTEEFDVQLKLSDNRSGAASDRQDADDVAGTDLRSTNLVELIGNPAPSSSPTTRRSGWSFCGRSLALRGGKATTAIWRWSSKRPEMVPAIDCGDLHCALAIKHGGPNRLLAIEWQVQGLTRRKDDVGYDRPYDFSSLSNPQVAACLWLLPTCEPTRELSAQDMDIQTKTSAKYSQHSQDEKEHSTAPVFVAQPLGTQYGHYYGTNAVSDHATVFLGNQYFTPATVSPQQPLTS